MYTAAKDIASECQKETTFEALSSDKLAIVPFLSKDNIAEYIMTVAIEMCVWSETACKSLNMFERRPLCSERVAKERESTVGCQAYK